MLAILVGAFLVLLLLLVHFWTRSNPLPETSPLDVDQNLPLPWAGHASSVFSLTALFGAYLAIFFLLGAAAILGVATGGVISLLFIRYWIEKTSAKSFEEFLLGRRFSSSRAYDSFYWNLMAATQLGFAVSELLILREVSLHAFSLSPRYASVFALAIALIAYFYCLQNGYLAVFRTDIVQFAVMIAMCLFIGLSAAVTELGSSTFELQPPLAPKLWTTRIDLSPAPTSAFHFLFGFLTGSCFLLASPDTWKRVFLASRNFRKRPSSFYFLTLAGAAPFILLSPAALLLPRPSLDSAEIFSFLYGVETSRPIIICITLGMVASFLSSFDSAFLSAVHILLVRRQGDVLPSLALYHYLVAGCFTLVATAFIFLGGILGNPYLLGLMLLCCYAILGGLVLGSQALTRPSRASAFPWVTVLILVLWFLYLLDFEDIVEKPVPEQVSAFVPGMLVFILYSLVAYLRSRAGGN